MTNGVYTVIQVPCHAVRAAVMRSVACVTTAVTPTTTCIIVTVTTTILIDIINVVTVIVHVNNITITNSINTHVIVYVII